MEGGRSTRNLKIWKNDLEIGKLKKFSVLENNSKTSETIKPLKETAN